MAKQATHSAPAAPPTKRRKLTPRPEEEFSGAEESNSGDRSDSLHEADSEADGSENDAGSSPDTDDEIGEPKWAKSKKTLKRKHRATDATRFGATLQTLLSTDAPSALPLSLKPSIARKRNDEKLETKGKKVLEVEKKEKEEKGRIRDVIGGWGGESERALRKVAQRGVVKLFNAIQQSQAASTTAAVEVKAQRGSGKPTLPAPVLDKKKVAKKGKEKDNVIGRGKETTLGQDDFLDIIRSGGIVAKA
ncbi:Rrp15p-domain-containing protein [Fomitopsis serialis]|uniref:Rrp15p-domain-containing protein n=1 Tax=Fomitopsis serialis TaxID=139415 RepID=UPI002007F6E3|nr:Rrp15p-domain-containing protein [Neoantrodia serialis]KAH9937202.1 Rrp15p-domain-containing protein [Neoantrodia serialis]